MLLMTLAKNIQNIMLTIIRKLYTEFENMKLSVGKIGAISYSLGHQNFLTAQLSNRDNTRGLLVSLSMSIKPL